MSARTKVYATITENWGTAIEHTTEKAVSLGDRKEWHDLATLIER